jgi:hypothetical protein
MDGMITKEEYIIGENWVKDWIHSINVAKDATVAIGSFDTTKPYKLDAVQRLALNSNFDDKIDYDMYLKYSSYNALWALMNADNTPVTKTKLLTYSYRNFADYSIWNYTEAIFTAMDLNVDAAISKDEFNKWMN